MSEFYLKSVEHYVFERVEHSVFDILYLKVLKNSVHFCEYL